MKWLRYRADVWTGCGCLDGDTVQVHRGALFDGPQASGERLALDGLGWLPPCRP